MIILKNIKLNLIKINKYPKININKYFHKAADYLETYNYRRLYSRKWVLLHEYISIRILLQLQ